MQKLKPFLLFIPLLIIMGCANTSCTQLLFEEAMPRQGEVVQVLPEFLDGTYMVQDSYSDGMLEPKLDQYYEFEKINDSHCIVQSYNGITKEALDREVQKLNTDTTSAELRGSTLIVKYKDETEVTTFYIEGDYYFTKKEPAYEINLEKGYFIDDFEEMEEQQLIFKSHQGEYFLNIAEKGNWAVIGIQPSKNSFFVRLNDISDTTFSETSSHHNAITPIQKLENKTYLVNPTDEAFYTLWEDEKLFEDHEWVRVGESAHTFVLSKTIILAGIVLLFVGFIFLGVFFRRS